MEAISVMLVDDERLAIEDLRNLIRWDEYGFEIVAEATNGKKALGLYEKYFPQIVIVDIRMPVMDGLEFSRRLLSHGRHTKIILLTAYKDFEYAKQAIEIGVSNYILKHDINEQSLLSELNKIKKELETEKRRHGVLRQQFLKEVLEGRTPDEWIRYENKDYIENPKENFALLLVHLDVPYPVMDGFVHITGNPIDERLDLTGLILPESIYYMEKISIDHETLAILVSIKKIYSQREVRETLYQTACHIQKKFRQQWGDTVSIVMTSTSCGIEGISPLYQKALNVIRYSVFAGREKIFRHQELFDRISHSPINVEPGLGRMSKSLKSVEINLVEAEIENLFMLATFPGWNYFGLKKVCSGLLYLLENYRQNNALASISADVPNRNDEWTDCWYSVDGIKCWFKEEFAKALKSVMDIKANGYSKKVQKAINYIEKHYSDDLTAERLGELFEINGIYLSQLLKKETGYTFLEYLTNCRIKAAKDLLATGKYKVYEVAEMVGYKTSQYFSQVFRKVTGINPLDFMEGGENDENEH
ncbi:MAG: helix-turn-helix protein [Clostridia bacterium]|jgi:CheY-like chemotaxis protein/AraC-like DNA-binding protein|uniref:response regulator transcription factor n=1 Tax=Petroclostridium xylanilyticum TaxID=1792311 RepID=UPI0018E2E47F|nr:response regulator [Petroclostridium xylanilyticum]MBZ4647445.1 helix-turn-helix protein [Clostridia bacterium]